MSYLFRSVIFVFGLCSCIAAYATTQDNSKELSVITFAVGPDHQEMMADNYEIYTASWRFFERSLKDLGYKLEAHSTPWARAIARVQSGELHGLFIAAKFKERRKWAAFSNPIGQEIYGAFINIRGNKNSNTNGIVAAVRMGAQDRVLSNVPQESMLQVPDAYTGLKLLQQRKVNKFLMAEGYGTFIIKTQLPTLENSIAFDHVGQTEQQSLHIAVAKGVPSSLAALAVINKAIQHGIEKGYYQQEMDASKVSQRMRLKMVH